MRATVALAICTAMVLGLAPAAIASPSGPDAAELAPTPDPTTTAAPTPTPTSTEAPAETPTPTPTPTPGAPEREAPDDGTDAGTSETAVQASMPAAGRIAGQDRFVRAVLASQAAFPSGADTVIVANGETEGGPFIAAAMAANRSAPVLYVKKSSIASPVSAELRRLDPSKIVTVGTSTHFSSSLITTLTRIAPVERVTVNDRFLGSRAALAEGGPVDAVYLTGANYANFAAATATAASTGRGVLMVNVSANVGLAVNALRSVGSSNAILVGSISAQFERGLTNAGISVSRRTGADVYALSLALAKDRTGSRSRVMTANPAVLTDAATAAALAAATGQPMVYTPRACMFTPTAAWTSSAGARVVGVGAPSWLLAAAVANTPCSTEKPRREAELASAIRSTLAQYPGSYSVSVRDFSRVGEVVGIEDHSRLEPASMMKLYAAYAILRLVQDGRLTLDNSILPSGLSMRTCIHAMIEASDNLCHNDLVHWIGIGELNRMIAAAGFSETSYGSVPYGSSVLYAGNRTTTSDLTEFVQRLTRGQLLNASLTSLLRREMAGQIFRSRIPSGLPPGIPQESKPGSLWIASGLLQADTAFVDGKQGDFAVSIIGVDGPSKAALSAVARLVYSYYNESFGSAASYPVQQMVTTRAVEFRSAPAGQVIAVMPVRVNVEVTDSSRIWYKVWWAGRLGWIDSRALTRR